MALKQCHDIQMIARYARMADDHLQTRVAADPDGVAGSSGDDELGQVGVAWPPDRISVRSV